MKSRARLLHTLHRASQLADALFARALEGGELTARQATVLASIAEREGCSQSDVVEATGIDRSTIADMLRRLVANGLVARRRAKADARAYVLKLTPLGAARLRRADAAMEQAESALVARLSPARREALTDALDAMIAAESSGSDVG